MSFRSIIIADWPFRTGEDWFVAPVEEAPAPAVHWWVYLVLTVLLFSSVAATVVLIIVLKRPKGKYHRR